MGGLAASARLHRAFRSWLKSKGRVEFRGRYRKIAGALLGDAIDILGSAGVDYHLDYGTLLGLVRSGDLIAWDGDLDVGICSRDWQAFEATFPAFCERGWQAPHDFNSMTVDSSAWSATDPRRVTIVSRRLLPFTIGRLRLDVLIKYRHEGSLYWIADGRLRQAPLRHFDGVREIEFEGRKARIPVEAEAYLTELYGDWNTPVRY
jgi:lipopolysaccharide cholinephosphotransferase